MVMRLVSAALLAASASALPNILFILADDQGYGDIGYNAIPSRQFIPGAGDRMWTPNPPHTPNLDALAADAATILWARHYSGSPVCSPTRSSLLSGRTPDRECVFDANGCGQLPEWTCEEPQPFPPSIFTAATAAKQAGYTTLHAGKFHLGDFFPKNLTAHPSYAHRKWPVVHPGMLGFEEWYSTEASASSTMCNCGCEAAWPSIAPGCDIGGGQFVMGESFNCTNYWQPTDSPQHPVPACHNPVESTRSCVANVTDKVPGDDTLFILQRFEAFLNTTLQNGSQPFFAFLQLHTNHVPHPALPEYYHAYNGTDGRPAGDYLGTLTQMDAGIGALLQLLQRKGVYNDTLLWYTADNGPHPGAEGDGQGGIPDVHTATNGLRQCKGSVFEGGIRVPGFVHWPGVITANHVSQVPVYPPDFLPTFLSLTQQTHPQPSFAQDGESVLPLLQGNTSFTRSKPLAWELHEQQAMLDPTGQYKVVRNPSNGECEWENSTYLPHNASGPFLFDVLADPTESKPLNAQFPALLANMTAALDTWAASIRYSQVYESQCLPAAENQTVLLTFDGACLAAASMSEHAHLVVSNSSCTTRSVPGSAASLNEWKLQAGTNMLLLASNSSWCFHANFEVPDPCASGNAVWLGNQCDGRGMLFDGPSETLGQPGCDSMCLGVDESSGSTNLVLLSCSDERTRKWEARNVTTRGTYLFPSD